MHCVKEPRSPHELFSAAHWRWCSLDVKESLTTRPLSAHGSLCRRLGFTRVVSLQLRFPMTAVYTTQPYVIEYQQRGLVHILLLVAASPARANDAPYLRT